MSLLSKRQLYRRIAQQMNNVLILDSENNSDPDTENNSASTTSLQPDASSSQLDLNDMNIDHEHTPPDNNSIVFLPENSPGLNCRQDLQFFLREWTLKFNISNVAVTALLKYLKVDHPDLMSDARTLLNTSSQWSCKVLNNGEYIHLGIGKSLTKFLQASSLTSLFEIKLTFNIDGLPLFHSSSIQFWPILADICGFRDSVFVVGIFCGKSKPDPLHSYLEDFINELKGILQNGINYKQYNIKVSVHCFVCDMPARAFLKCVKSHNAYSSCDKCTCYGNYIEHRVVLDDLDSDLRSDDSFLLQTDEDYHLGISPLSTLPIGLVTKFPIDYMHSVCLGVVRKLLHSWIKPVRGDVKHVKLNSHSISLINERLEYVRQFVPIEFNRKPRSVQEIDRWKATEYRTLLLYIGPVVLYGILKKPVYQNFLILHCSISILVSQQLTNKYSNYAKYLLKEFVNECVKIYGRQYLVYNVHSLIHLADDAERFGALDNISAFRFENFLGTPKALIRNPHKPLQQVCNRVTAKQFPDYSGCTINMNYSQQHYDGPVPPNSNFKQYRKLTCKDFVLSTNTVADSVCMLNDKTIFKIVNILMNGDNSMLYGNVYAKSENFFMYPCPSKYLDIVLVSEISEHFILKPFTDVLNKCISIPFFDKNVVFPLRHVE